MEIEVRAARSVNLKFDILSCNYVHIVDLFQIHIFDLIC